MNHFVPLEFLNLKHETEKKILEKMKCSTYIVKILQNPKKINYISQISSTNYK